eukprot:TRINITY_DN13247_c0_g1_i1.p1 TRINITY_DN13247_c0_g1~~TRINITY_DN13247_c0_g1_i1.p1  ORF type:complete len:1164 (+),score=193.23 TRINITY_DN13247_c0_g1_i1:89-3580(+)
MIGIPAASGVLCGTSSLMVGLTAVGLSAADVHHGIMAGAVVLLSLAFFAASHMAGKIYIQRPLEQLSKLPLKEGTPGAQFSVISELRTALRELQHTVPPKQKLVSPNRGDSAEGSSYNMDPIFTPTSIQAPEGRVTFVFTDIESSSVLWRKHPEDMKTAMRLHNNCIREAYSRYNGYEVKTIGDAFMITFDQANDAVRFCIDAQVDLLNCPWPEKLLTDSMCNSTIKGGQLIYRGMRVRMGVHTGDVTMEIDPVTTRADYFGHTVNTAARIESAGQGGTIVCSDAVISATNPSILKCSIVPLGSIELKGVGKAVLHGIVPTSISERSASLAHKKTPLESSLMSSPALSDPAAKGKISKTLLKEVFTDRLMSDNEIRKVFTAITENHKLVAVNGTVIQIRISVNIDKLEPYVNLLNTLSKKTFGIILSGPMETLTLVWICQQHAVQAISFATALYSETSLHPEYKMHIGLASGGINFGITHASDKQYITCVGSPMELSSALAEAAEQLNTVCLVPGTIIAHAPSLTRLVRPVDRWFAGDSRQTYIEVNEMHLKGLTQTEKWDLLYGIHEDTAWCDPQWGSGFDEAKVGDLRKMKEMSEKYPDDIMCKKIIAAEGKQICRTTFVPGHQIIPDAADRVKENLEQAWKRTTAASKSSSASLVYMEGWAYDISAFMHSHPGGREVLREWVGKDITDAFRGQGIGKAVHDHTTYAADILRTLRVFKTNNLATNESNMMIVRDTWKQLKTIGMQEIGYLLFRNMFEMHPEYLELFPWGSEAKVYESRGMLDHGLQVMTAVDKAVTDLSNSHEVAHILHELGKTHLRFGVKKPMFDVMGTGFDATFRTALQEKYTPQVRYAWMSTINHILLMAKDGIADLKEEPDNAIVTGEYRSVQYRRREARTHNTILFTFYLHGISEQYFAPACHVSLRFNGKLSRMYTVVSVLNDEISLLVKTHSGKLSSKELQLLTTDSMVEMRGPILGEHQYTKGQDLLLIGGGTGCNPLISLSRAALKDNGNVWFICCANTYGDVAHKPEFEELSHSDTGKFEICYLFTKGKTQPEGLTSILAPMITREHLEGFLPPPSAQNHTVICGTPAFNTNVRRLVLELSYTFTVCGSLSESAMDVENFAAGRKKSIPAGSPLAAGSPRSFPAGSPQIPGLVDRNLQAME